MANVEKISVALTPELAAILREAVEMHEYASVSEVVREALRLMDEQDRLRQAKLEELRRELRKGLDSGPSEPWDAAAVKAKARSRRVAKPAAV